MFEKIEEGKKFRRILLIDDDEINNALNQMILEKFGYADETIIFENAFDALDYISKNQGMLPEVALLDIKMPIMDGFQFLEEAEKICQGFTKKIAVYILTSSRNEGDIKRAGNYELAGFLVKPLTPQMLDSISAFS